jgi:hypothetical protein
MTRGTKKDKGSFCQDSWMNRLRKLVILMMKMKEMMKMKKLEEAKERTSTIRIVI